MKIQVAGPILFEVLGKDVLKFDTKKSFDYFIACKDNHKAWQAFQVFLHGTTMELIRYYASTLEHGIVPSAIGNQMTQCQSPLGE